MITSTKQLVAIRRELQGMDQASAIRKAHLEISAGFSEILQAILTTPTKRPQAEAETVALFSPSIPSISELVSLGQPELLPYNRLHL